jgi:large subunit ribosomal protein L3
MHGHSGDAKVNIKSVPVELINKEIRVIGLRG